MRDEPLTGEEVGLVLQLESEEEDLIEAVKEAVETLGGEVLKELQFGGLRVRIEQTDIDSLCEIAGIESIETENSIGFSGDAGEDV